MKNLIRGSVVALIGAAALLAAYASLSGPPAAGGAKPPAARAARAPASPPHASAPAVEPASGGALAPGNKWPGCGDCLVAAASDCDFCLYATDAGTADPAFAGLEDPWRLPDGDRYAPAVANFGEWPGATALTGFKLDAGDAAAAPEMSTAAMLALGVVMLTARMRRNARACWKTAWTKPALATPP